MDLKSFRFGLLTIGCLVSATSLSYANTLSPQSFNALYSLAARGDLSTINSARARGLYIDAVNSSGDTGLCVAAKRRDRRAYRSFLQAGANPSHPCTWEIGGYRDFMQSSITNAPRNMDTAVTAKHLTESKMSWKTKALIGTGIVAAGAGVGLALGGGGGGGSSYDPNCVHGYYNKSDVCTCYNGYSGDKCNECSSGYDKHGTNTCHKTLDCINGYQKGDKCVCDKGYDGKFCHTCADGYGKDVTGMCVRKLSQKIIGNAEMNTNHNPSNNLSVVNEDYADVYGIFYDADKTPHNYLLEQDKLANGYVLSESFTAKTAIPDYVYNIDDNIVWFSGTEDNPTPMGYLIGSEAYSNSNNDSPIGSMLDDVIYGTNGEVIGHAYKIGTTEGEEEFFSVANDSYIKIQNIGDGTIFGLYSNNAETIYNNYVKLSGSGIVVNNTSDKSAGYSYAQLDIISRGNGNVYGIYGNKIIYSGDFNETGAKEGSEAYMRSIVNIENEGDGDAYGIYIHSENGEIYHQDKRGSYFNLTSKTSVKNVNGTGNTYGLYALGKISNSGLVFSTADAGNAYGLYTKGGSIENTKDDNELSLVNSVEAVSNTGAAYGAYVEGGSIKNGRIIYAKTTAGSENAYGIYAVKTKDKDVSVENTSGIKVESFGGDAYGIYNKGGTVKNSTQYYQITVTSLAGIAYGIYSDGGNVENKGQIFVNGSSDAKSFGIYATNNAKVTNTGDFLFNIRGAVLNPDNADTYCTSSGCITPGGGWAIYLTNGAKFVNAGNVSSAGALDLGNGGTSLSTNGVFSASSISGNLSVDTDVVAKGFETTYTLSDAIKSADVSGLKINSESVLFDANLQGTDVILSKKDFNDVIENKEVANFLEHNYALSQNEQLFKELKSQTNINEVNSMLNQIIGQDVVSRFSDEDLLLQKELDFNVTEKLFKTNDEYFAFSGNISSNTFDYNSNQTRYAVSGKNFGNVRLGVGMAVSKLKTDNGHLDNVRNSYNYQFMAPIQLKNKDMTTVIMPKLAYSYGSYSRDGYNNTDYKGKIEKQMMGVSAQSKYKFDLFGLNIIPTSEANITAYKTKISENDKLFSLSSENNHTYSATLGFGAYVEKEQIWAKNKFNFMFGAMMYHEFANPYDLEMNINGMSGSFTLRDEKRQDDYMVLRSKFSYDFNNISLYGDFLSYVDSQYRSRIDLGFKYSF